MNVLSSPLTQCSVVHEKMLLSWLFLEDVVMPEACHLHPVYCLESPESKCCFCVCVLCRAIWRSHSTTTETGPERHTRSVVWDECINMIKKQYTLLWWKREKWVLSSELQSVVIHQLQLHEESWNKMESRLHTSYSCKTSWAAREFFMWSTFKLVIFMQWRCFVRMWGKRCSPYLIKSNYVAFFKLTCVLKSSWCCDIRDFLATPLSISLNNHFSGSTQL